METNDFFDWLDEQEPEQERGGEWTCDTIEKAEAAARRLRQASDRIAAIDAVADKLIADANAWRAEASSPYAAQAEVASSDIETFLRVQIDAGGPKSAPLPHGVSVSARKTGGTFVFADGFADSAPDDVVKITRKVDAKAAKMRYKETDQGVIDTVTGELVEGVSVTPIMDKVTVKS